VIIVDHDECEKATLSNIGLASKTVIIFIDLEDKVIFIGVGDHIINVVLIPCLFSNIICNEKTIGDIKVVEVEMIEKIRDKKMLLSSWSNALQFYHVQIMDTLEVISREPLEGDSLNSQIFFTHYQDYCRVGKGTWWQIKAKNMRTQGIMAYDGNIKYCEVKKHITVVPCCDFFNMFVMCEIRPWKLIDPTINLCKILVVLYDKPHTNSLYEDVILYISCYDLSQLNLPNHELMEYGVCGTWVTYPCYNDYHVFDWHIAWVCQIVMKKEVFMVSVLALRPYWFYVWRGLVDVGHKLVKMLREREVVMWSVVILECNSVKQLGESNAKNFTELEQTWLSTKLVTILLAIH
jgi:hypothetical protein